MQEPATSMHLPVEDRISDTSLWKTADRAVLIT